MLNRSRDKKGHQEQDTNYPCMKVKLSRWEDGDPTSWISMAEIFFCFRKTPKESKVEISSIQLERNAIQ
ncbi:hypothetical protein BHE74_00001913 [Ensete ventricosum]|uniref:Uncharacterized protein n=1 Tax=Ensete ventricosum TaxID=4639 RepID=A0A426XGX7_ENSVE|nr:hypothetical protein B296_00054467 [Ensete ventricosum]RWW89109.1 hypothetical protein BHE74_00001913 [Ensete ventricosum]